MAMKFSDSGSDDEIVAEINITPLTDIFLVLLIIFMISSSAMMEGGLQVKLPTAKSTGISSSQGGKPIFITVDKTGEILVNEKAAVGNLADTIRETLAQTTEKTVVIRGDEAVFLGKAVEIMDAARSAGAEKIALATQPPGKN